MFRIFLDVCTSHVSHQTMERIGEWGSPTTHGALVYAPGERANEDMPNDLWAVLSFARSMGAEYVLFDGDAPTITALTTFDW